MNRLLVALTSLATFMTSIVVQEAAADSFIIPVCFQKRICGEKDPKCWDFGVSRYVFDTGNYDIRKTDEIDASYGVAAQARERSYPHDVPGELFVGAECLQVMPTAFTAPTVRYEEINDRDHVILKYADLRRRTAFSERIVFSELECNVNFDKECSETTYMEAGLGWQACTVLFQEVYFGGSEKSYGITPLNAAGAIAKPPEPVVKFQIKFAAKGNGQVINRVGARVALGSVGMSRVLANASDDDAKALGCNPYQRFGRGHSGPPIEGSIQPSQCTDSNGQGYYCTGNPPSGTAVPGGIPIYRW